MPVEKVCEECGKSYTIRPYLQTISRFCCASCRSKWTFRIHPPDYAKIAEQARGNTHRKGLKPTNAYQPGQNQGKNHPRWVEPLHFICEYCYLPFDRKPWQVSREKNKGRFCSTACRLAFNREAMTGENNHAWRGGHEDYYGADWEEQRRAARERDLHTCQDCGKTRKESGKELDVHHLQRFADFTDYREANRLENLITLCHSCHLRREWRDNPEVRGA